MWPSVNINVLTNQIDIRSEKMHEVTRCKQAKCAELWPSSNWVWDQCARGTCYICTTILGDIEVFYFLGKKDGIYFSCWLILNLHYLRLALTFFPVVVSRTTTNSSFGLQSWFPVFVTSQIVNPAFWNSNGWRVARTLGWALHVSKSKPSAGVFISLYFWWKPTVFRKCGMSF